VKKERWTSNFGSNFEWLNGYVNEQAVYGFEAHNEIFPMVTYTTPIS